MHVQDLNGIGMIKYLTLSAVVAICSVALNKPPINSAVILGDMTISGTIMKVEELANTMKVCLDSGRKEGFDSHNLG